MKVYAIFSSSVQNNAQDLLGITDSVERCQEFVATYNLPDYHCGDYCASALGVELNELPTLEPKYQLSRLKKDVIRKFERLTSKIQRVRPYDIHQADIRCLKEICDKLVECDKLVDQAEELLKTCDVSQ